MELSHLGVEKLYFENEENFNLDHVINELPDNLTSDFLLDYKSKLERSLNIVTRKVSELILSHQPTYVDELQRIADLQKSITDSIRVCTQGRSCLTFIKEGTRNGSTIVDHYKKKESLTQLLNSLTVISDLKNSVFEIRSLIHSQDDFPKAIQMCKDGEALLAPFKEYKCVHELGLRLNDTIELIGEQVDAVLEEMSLAHDINLYSKLQASYVLMNRSEIAVDQLLKKFNAYHKSSTDELKMFLENEIWEMVPVKNDFKLVQLKEFSFLRPSSTSNSYQISDEMNETSDQFFLTENQSSQYVIPFDKAIEKGKDTIEDIYTHFDPEELLPMDKISLSSESDDSELNKDFVQEDEYIEEQVLQPQKKQGPVLTNSSLNVLRLIGRYIQMMSVLEPISYEILMKVYELLDHYIKFVFEKFGPDGDRKSDTTLRTVIKNVRESLIGGISNSSLDDSHGDTNMDAISSTVLTSVGANTDDEQQIDPKKMIAVESLIFLVNQLWNLQEYLESLIPANLRPQLREQFTQQHSVVPDFLKVRAEL